MSRSTRGVAREQVQRKSISPCELWTAEFPNKIKLISYYPPFTLAVILHINKKRLNHITCYWQWEEKACSQKVCHNITEHFPEHSSWLEIIHDPQVCLCEPSSRPRLRCKEQIAEVQTSQATIFKAKWKKVLVQACIPKYQYSRVRIFWINWWLSETKLNSLL